MYKNVEKVCIHCNKTYLGNPKTKYCGYDCSHAVRQRKVILTCQICGKSFERQLWNSNARFCSYTCKTKSQCSEVLEVSCTNCGTIFKRKSHLLKRNSSGNAFCSNKCSNIYNTGANHYEWKEHLHDKNESLALKQWALKIKERDSYICQLCGEKDKLALEAHHMKSRSKFPELKFDFNNGITLCLKCHALQHLNDPRALRLITYKINNYGNNS